MKLALPEPKLVELMVPLVLSSEDDEIMDLVKRV
jgi:hypothetical protein